MYRDNLTTQKSYMYHNNYAIYVSEELNIFILFRGIKKAHEMLLKIFLAEVNSPELSFNRLQHTHWFLQKNNAYSAVVFFAKLAHLTTTIT